MIAAAIQTSIIFSASASILLSFSPPLRRHFRLCNLLIFSPHTRFLSCDFRSLPSMSNATSSEATSTPDVTRAGDNGGHQEPSIPITFSMETQFEHFRSQLEDSGSVRERIRSVASEIEATLRVMHANILLVHQSLPIEEVLHKADSQIEVLRVLYKRLAEILRQCPGQYYRYHGDWRSETQTAVSMLAFAHWLETGSLLSQEETEKKLELNPSEFGLDIEDYLTGLCFMSNELPRYVVNQVSAGDYDCPKNVLNFLTELHSAFRMLNLRNDFLRKKFDGMKYDLRRVEDVYYDVKIRGLAPSS